MFHRCDAVVRPGRAWTRLLGFAAIALAAAADVGGAHAADAANGQRHAQRWCASCHVIGPQQQQASADVPSFQAIARRPGFNAGTVALFLLDPHPKMPNMNLTRSEAADLAAYIATQK